MYLHKIKEDLKRLKLSKLICTSCKNFKPYLTTRRCDFKICSYNNLIYLQRYGSRKRISKTWRQWDISASRQWDPPSQPTQWYISGRGKKQLLENIIVRSDIGVSFIPAIFFQKYFNVPEIRLFHHTPRLLRVKKTVV